MDLQKVLASNDPFDLAIIDLHMPNISGYEVARQIRKWERGERNRGISEFQIPLIALSSLMERDAKKCEDSGFSGFLSKPARRKNLYQMMERIIGIEQREDSESHDRIVTQYSIKEEIKHSVRILLAEDNPVNQKLAMITLTKAGYQVEVSNNGREAVNKYIASPGDFDLLFMDVQMPEMDGLEATKAIRNSGFGMVEFRNSAIRNPQSAFQLSP